MNETEALIIGGGPAGLASAIVLAGSGVSTVVIEKQDYPVNKPCGEGIMPAGVGHLHSLGVAVDRLPGGRPFVGIRYHGGPAITAAATFAEGPGIGVRRTALSEALYKRAVALPTLDLRMGVTARPVARHGPGIVVSVDGEEVATRLLVGADGINSRVRRWARLDGGAPRWRRWGARRHFRRRPWSEYVEVYWSERGVEAYVTPTGPDEVGVALLWHADRFRAAGGDRLFPSLLAPFPELQARLYQAKPLDPVAAVGPLHRPVPEIVADGVLLIGDASGYLDAITGEGISVALAQALALKETVLPLLVEDRRLDRAALVPYRRRHRALTRSYLRFTRLVLFLSDHPALVRPTIRLLGRWPRLFRLALSASMGTR